MCRVLSKATDFSEAADQLKGAAKEYFSDIDKSTNGEFAKLQGDRSDILRALRRTDKFNEMQDLRNELARIIDALVKHGTAYVAQGLAA